MQLNATITGLMDLYKDLDAHTKKQQRALQTAIKVEGLRQLKLLRQAVTRGEPSGHPYAAQLSALASRTKSGRLRKNLAPLYRLAKLLRYNVDYSSGDLRFYFGFVNTNKSTLSSTYKDLLISHQEGTDVLYKGSRSELGKRFARIGGKLKKKGDPDARYFFLRKTTGRKLDLPKRPIIDPFFEANRGDAVRNIRQNFRLKMAGQRI